MSRRVWRGWLAFWLVGAILAVPVASSAVAARPAVPEQRDAAVERAVRRYFNTIPPSHYKIQAGDLQKRLAAGEKPFLLDIRGAGDFAVKRIPGFVNIPFAELGREWDRLPRDRMIIVICYTGQSAGQTVALLRLAGFGALSLDGGFEAVEQGGLLPIER